jgi:hypothetical protein
MGLFAAFLKGEELQSEQTQNGKSSTILSSDGRTRLDHRSDSGWKHRGAKHFICDPEPGQIQLAIAAEIAGYDYDGVNPYYTCGCDR